jgi:hypothetical protein
MDDVAFCESWAGNPSRQTWLDSKVTSARPPFIAVAMARAPLEEQQRIVKKRWLHHYVSINTENSN